MSVQALTYHDSGRRVLSLSWTTLIAGINNRHRSGAR